MQPQVKEWTLDLPFSGPRALSAAEVGQLQALQSANPGNNRFQWSKATPVWDLQDNPCHPPEDPMLHLYFIDGVPVAGVETVRDQVIVDGKAVEWMWIGNQLTLPDYRGRGLMSLLFKEVLKLADERGICVGGAGVRPAGRAVYLKNGLTFWGLAPRQVLLLRTDKLVENYLKSRAMTAGGAALPNALLGAFRGGIGLSLWPSARRYRVEFRDVFDEDVAPLFDTIPQYPRFSRAIERMRWRWARSVRYRSPPQSDYRLGFLKNLSGGGLAGFIMLRLMETDEPGGVPAKRLRVVTVLDWGTRYQDRQAQQALVWHAVRSALEMGGDLLEFTTTDRSLRRILKSRGFLTLGGYRLFYYGAQGTPLAGKRPEDLPEWWWNGPDVEDSFRLR